MPVVEEYVDAVVVGAGHAGCGSSHLPVQDWVLRRLFLQSVLTVLL